VELQSSNTSCESSDKPEKRSDGKYWALALTGTVGAFLALNFDLLTCHCLFKWDAWNEYWPWFRYLADSLRGGSIPLWDPHSCCGFPYHAEPETGAFHPVYLATTYLFGGGFRVFQYLWLGHWLGGVLGFFFLAKRFRFSPVAAFAGSVMFGFNGFFMGHGEHTVWILAVSYVPWMLLLLEVAAQEGLYYAVAGGVLFGLTGPGINVSIYSAIMIAAWVFLRNWGLKKSILLLSVFFAVGSLVMAPSIIPYFVELAGYTDRVGALSIENACNTHKFLLTGIFSMLAPGLTVGYPGFFRSNIPNVPMLNVYIGIFGVMALVFVLLDRALRKTWLWLLVFMAISFLFSLGTEGGLRVIGYYVLPPLRYVRHSSLIRFFWLLGGAMLAMAVIDRILSADEGRRRELVSKAISVLVALFCATLAVLVWLWLSEDRVVEYAFQRIGLAENSAYTVLSLGGGQLVLCGLFIAVLYLWKSRVNSQLAVALLLAVILADAATHVWTNKATLCWNDIARKVATEYDRMADARRGMLVSGDEKRLAGPVLHNLGNFDGRFYIRSYVPARSSNYDHLVGNTWPPVHDTPFLKALTGGPRFFLTANASLVSETDKQALDRLTQQASADRIPVMVHREICVGKTENALSPAGKYGSVTVAEYRPERIVLKVDAPENCVLFAAERFAPSWKAFLDGNPVPICKANFCFRAVSVPKGRHKIEMEYRPWVYKPCIVLSWSMIAIVLFWSLTRAWRRRGKPREVKWTG
jgi:Bacterial membrane protein YfhO